MNSAILKYPVKVTYIPKAFYHYEQQVNVNSLSQNYTLASFEEDIKLVNAFECLLVGTSACQLAVGHMEATLVMRAFFGGVFGPYEFRRKVIEHAKRAIFRESVAIRFFVWSSINCPILYPILRGLLRDLLSLKSKLLNNKYDH